MESKSFPINYSAFVINGSRALKQPFIIFDI